MKTRDVNQKPKIRFWASYLVFGSKTETQFYFFGNQLSNFIFFIFVMEIT